MSLKEEGKAPWTQTIKKVTKDISVSTEQYSSMTRAQTFLKAT